jgi:hypothetical protein
LTGFHEDEDEHDAEDDSIPVNFQTGSYSGSAFNWSPLIGCEFAPPVVNPRIRPAEQLAALLPLCLSST